MTSRKLFQAIRRWIGDKCLDLAEALPQVKRGPIYHLQSIREHQRRRSSDPLLDPSPPANSELRLSSIRLIEGYSIENFDALRIALQALFPDLPRHPGRDDFFAELGKSIRRLQAGAWWNIGLLVRDRKGLLPALPLRELPHLPCHVHSIGVKAHHVMPSLVVLTFDVQLTDAAARELNRVQAKPYLSEITFTSVFPWRFGHSERPVETVRQERVREWVERLRLDVERILQRSLEPGLFGSGAKAEPRLPAVEIYLLSLGENGTISEQWEQRARWWLDSYGVNLRFDLYRSSEALFQWARQHHYTPLISGHILMLFREQFLASIGNPGMYATETDAILYNAEASLDDLMPVLLTVEVLQQTRVVIESLRERVFRRISSGKPLLRFGRLQRLNAELQGQSVLLSRLKAEYSQHKNWVRRKMKTWESFVFFPKTAGTEEDLKSASLGWINYQFEIFEVHLRLVRDAFAEYFTARNTRAVFLLTIAVVILTVVQLLTNEYIQVWFSSIWGRARDFVVPLLN